MLAKDLISEAVIPLSPSDPATIAAGVMDDLRVSHLPIVDNDTFIGLISETDILDLNAPGEPVGSHALSSLRPYVWQGQHIFEVLRLVANQKLTLVPVLDDQSKYLGCITLGRIAQAMAEMGAVQQPGGVIVLEVNSHDYSLSEISRIVESNDAKVLSSFITSFIDSTKLEVTIKVNKMDVSPILQTFTRYDYIIVASFSEEILLGDLIHDRFDSLMSYLNV
ncbi:MAG: CBS domain-containing protein [Bacteroidales bacterium]